jgi:hypothetical protein
MTRRSPTILSALFTADGSIEVTWEVDSFFSDSADPEKVLIDLNGINFTELDGDETSTEIPAAALAPLGAQVAIGVIFWWDGVPPEEQQSVVVLPLTQGAGAGNSGVLPAAKPVVSVVHVRPRTVSAPATIRIAWRSNNYNDGNIIWGPGNAPTAFTHSIRPQGEQYSGEFETNKPLSPATQYIFKVEVRNTLHSPGWISTTIVVRSQPDTLSVRTFLQTSGRPVTTGLATVVGPSKSVRTLLVG